VVKPKKASFSNDRSLANIARRPGEKGARLCFYNGVSQGTIDPWMNKKS